MIRNRSISECTIVDSINKMWKIEPNYFLIIINNFYCFRKISY